MTEPRKDFAEKVRQAWGNPERVAAVGIIETFNHEDRFDFDRDDQLRNATRIGVIAGKTADKRPEDFIESFTALLNEK